MQAPTDRELLEIVHDRLDSAVGERIDVRLSAKYDFVICFCAFGVVLVAARDGRIGCRVLNIDRPEYDDLDAINAAMDGGLTRALCCSTNRENVEAFAYLERRSLVSGRRQQMPMLVSCRFRLDRPLTRRHRPAT